MKLKIHFFLINLIILSFSCITLPKIPKNPKFYDQKFKQQEKYLEKNYYPPFIESQYDFNGNYDYTLGRNAIEKNLDKKDKKFNNFYLDNNNLNNKFKINSFLEPKTNIYKDNYCDKAVHQACENIRKQKELFKNKNSARQLEKKIFEYLGLNPRGPLKNKNLKYFTFMNFKSNYFKSIEQGLEKKYIGEYIKILYHNPINLILDQNIIYHLNQILNFLLDKHAINSSVCGMNQFMYKNFKVLVKGNLRKFNSPFLKNSKYYKYIELIKRNKMKKNNLNYLMIEFGKYIAFTLRNILERRIKMLEKYINSENYKTAKILQEKENQILEDEKYEKENMKKDADFSLYLGQIYAKNKMENIISTKFPSKEYVNNEDIKCPICLETLKENLMVMVCKGTSNNESSRKHVVHSHCMNEGLMVKFGLANLDPKSDEFKYKFIEVSNTPNIINHKTFECPTCRSTENWEMSENPYYFGE